MLVQPILSKDPEPGHAIEDVLGFEEFNELLKKEEEYTIDDLLNTKLTITRLRKIFYDKFGWDTKLIKQGAKIENRYLVTIIDCSLITAFNRSSFKKVNWYIDNIERPKCRSVTYRTDDKVFGNTRAGCTPEIYDKDHADVRLIDNFFCDMGHILAGLDALNNPQIVSPLPSWLFFFHRCFIYVESNADVTTWLGDIATSGAAFLFNYLKNNRANTEEEEQTFINKNASASDMMGNIDAFVIPYFNTINTNCGERVTDIFTSYFTNGPNSKQKFVLFCERVGLQKWDGTCFSNENQWMHYYVEQLRNTIAFMVYSSTGDVLQKFVLPYKVWKKRYDHVVKPTVLLTIFLDEIKKQLMT